MPKNWRQYSLRSSNKKRGKEGEIGMKYELVFSSSDSADILGNNFQICSCPRGEGGDISTIF